MKEMENMKSKYNNFLEITGGIVAILSSIAMIIACIKPAYSIVSDLFEENTLAAGWVIPVSYVILYLAFMAILLILSLKIIGYFGGIEKREETDVKENKLQSVVKYYVIPALFGLFCFGVCLFLISNSHWLFAILIIGLMILIGFLLVAKKQDRFLTGSHIFPLLIMVFPIFLFDLYAWLPVILIILSVAWFIIALLRSINFFELIAKQDRQPEILKSATVQKLLASKIAQLQVKMGRHINAEFEKIKKEYITQPVNEDLEIEPAIKRLIENNGDYLEAIDKITKRLSEISKKSVAANDTIFIEENNETKDGRLNKTNTSS